MYNCLEYIIVSLTQLIWTMNNIYKIQGSNPDHQKKKTLFCIFQHPPALAEELMLALYPEDPT